MIMAFNILGLFLEELMEVIEENPPNIEEIKKVLKINNDIIFSWGDKIYNPGKHKLTLDLIIHEDVHLERQGRTEEGAKEWWKLYLEDPQFRLDEEVLAYGKQLKYIKANFNDEVYKIVLFKIADALSSELYGKLASFQKAESLVRRISKIE